MWNQRRELQNFSSMLHEFLFGFLCKKYTLPFFIWRKLQRFLKTWNDELGDGAVDAARTYFIGQPYDYP